MKTLKFEYQDETGSSKISEVKPKGVVFGKTPHTTQDQWLLEATDVQSNEDRLYVMNNIHRMIDDKVQKFLCVTTYVMDDESRFLMLHNRKLDKWVPPGGKVDRDETPDQSAVRECFEETGVNIDLVGEKTPVDGGLINPYGTQLNPIIPGLRDHVDLIYFGHPQANQVIKRSEREASDIGWFTLEGVLELDTFPSAIQWCKFFNEKMRK